MLRSLLSSFDHASMVKVSLFSAVLSFTVEIAMRTDDAFWQGNFNQRRGNGGCSRCSI
ncbi:MULTISPECIES: hypothetical protein [Enterovibrio]|uniref:hypothetical protein n=1 Tax=Enterovibrio TaxID=188143 RepID=UPI0018E9606D|nr:hypothetical protein [Enterovibrio norvegicus]